MNHRGMKGHGWGLYRDDGMYRDNAGTLWEGSFLRIDSKGLFSAGHRVHANDSSAAVECLRAFVERGSR